MTSTQQYQPSNTTAPQVNPTPQTTTPNPNATPGNNTTTQSPTPNPSNVQFNQNAPVQNASTNKDATPKASAEPVKMKDLLPKDNRDFTWEWKNPEKINEAKMGGKDWKEAESFSRKRLDALKSIPNYPGDDEGLLTIHEKNTNDEALEAHKNLMTSANDLVNLFNKEVENAEKDRQLIEVQYKDSVEVIANLQTRLNELEYKIQHDKNESLSEAGKFMDIVCRINFEDFKGLKLKENNKKIHNLFRWIHEVILGSKGAYDWKDFKERNFKKAANPRAFKVALGTFNIHYQALSGMPDTTMKAILIDTTLKPSINESFTMQVFNDRAAILKESEVKGKENPSVKALIEYVSIFKKLIDRQKDLIALEGQFSALLGELKERTGSHIALETKMTAATLKIETFKRHHAAYQNIYKHLYLTNEATISRQNNLNAYINKNGGLKKLESLKEKEEEMTGRGTSPGKKSVHVHATRDGEVDYDDHASRGCNNAQCSTCNIF